MGSDEVKLNYQYLIVQELLMGQIIKADSPLELHRLSAAFMSNMAQIGVQMKDKVNYHPI